MEFTVYKGRSISQQLATYMEGLDAGIDSQDHGGGMFSFGFTRDTELDGGESSFSIELWSNVEDQWDAFPDTLAEDAQVVLRFHGHNSDINVDDILHTGSALECLNWMVAEGRMNRAEEVYMPIFKRAMDTGVDITSMNLLSVEAL